jgi:hypothetical protein
MGSATPSSRAAGAVNFSANSVFAFAEEKPDMLVFHPRKL